MRVLTYNIWFDKHAADERYVAVLEILRRSDAEVICLQEVLSPVARILAELPWVREHYAVSDPSGDSCDPYGVLILARADLEPRFSQHTLPTVMNRKLLTAACRSGGREVTVGTVHLESLDSAEMRARQLEAMGRILDGDAILAGDLNFCSYRNYRPGEPLENDSLPRYLPGFIDVWPALRDGEPGYTYDAAVNTMIRTPRPDPQMRYDRVLAAGPKPTSIELVGTAPIDAGRRLFPSDHFGLSADFLSAR